MNDNFFKSIEPVLIKLREKIGDDFIVFGSAPLYLLGVAEFNQSINDLDITVKDLSKIPAEAEEVTFHKDQKLYKLVIDNVKIDIGSLWPGYEEFFEKIFDQPIVYKRFKFANLDVVEEWKVRMAREFDRDKDRKYIEMIRAYKSIKVMERLNFS